MRGGTSPKVAIRKEENYITNEPNGRSGKMTCGGPRHGVKPRGTTWKDISYKGGGVASRTLTWEKVVEKDKEPYGAKGGTFKREGLATYCKNQRVCCCFLVGKERIGVHWG